MMERWEKALVAMSRAERAFTIQVLNLQEQRGCSFTEAYEAARREHPDLFRSAFGDGTEESPQPPPQLEESPQPAAASVKLPAVVMAFVEKIQEVKRARGLSFAQAFEAARREHPDLFERAAEAGL